MRIGDWSSDVCSSDLRTGLIQPGSLFESKYRIRLAPGTDAHALRERLERRYATAGWEFKDRDRAAPGANRFFERMGQFLSLIGLTALVIAGIGVSNGVRSEERPVGEECVSTCR